MCKNLKIFAIIFLIQLFIGNPPLKADTLSFDDVLQKSIDNSFDLKISDVNVDISKAEYKEAKSDYYPTLRLGYSNEYENNLDKKMYNFASVGSTFVNPNTQFQNLISMNLTYNLFDFGARGKKTSIAKHDIFQKEIMYYQALRDLKLEVLENFTNALISFKEIEAQQKIKDIYTQLFEAKLRLYEAGTASKLDIMDEAVNIGTAKYRIDNTKHDLANALNELSGYTFEDYDPENVNVQIFDDLKTYEEPEKKEDLSAYKLELADKMDLIPAFKADVIIERKIYDIEIQKKQDELAMVKKERLPKFEFYTSYLFYGSDEDNPVKSLTNIRNKNVSVGISALMPVFDGFKNSAQQDKIKLEIERLRLEQEKKTYEMKKKYNKVNKDALYYKKEFENNEALLKEYKQQLNAIERLTDNQLLEKTELLRKKSDLITQILQLEKSMINAYATFKKLEFLSEGYQ